MVLTAVETGTEIRLLEARHAEELFALVDRNRDHVRPWLPWADRNRNVEEVAEFIRQSLEGFSKEQLLSCGIWHEGKLVGGIGSHFDTRNGLASVGYWIGTEWTGRGLVTKAAGAMVDYLFREYGFERVEIRCQVENGRSRAIPERLGFTEEGTFRRALRNSGRNVDVVVYAMLREEWIAR